MRLAQLPSTMLGVVSLILTLTGCVRLLGDVPDSCDPRDERSCPAESLCIDGRCVAMDTDADVESDGEPDDEPGGGGDADAETDRDIPLDPRGLGTWIPVAAGTSTMGSPPDEAGRLEEEMEHEVTLTRAFELLATEVSQADYEEVMGFNPSASGGCPGCPVERVSWWGAAAFCNALSDLDGLERCYDCTGSGMSVECEPVDGSIYDCSGYRLPTEAEWERAARAGTRGATYNGDLSVLRLVCESPNPVLDPIAWFCGNSGDRPHEIGTRDPNPWGIFDMLGNVWEWCHDRFNLYPDGPVTDPEGDPAASYRVLRGGSWRYEAAEIRAAHRTSIWPGYRDGNVGFRPARTLP